MASLGKWVLGVALLMVAQLSLNAEAQSVPACSESNVLGYWAFNGAYQDISHVQLGQAIPVGGDISLQWTDICSSIVGHVHVGDSGHLDVPRVDIYNISFTVSFDIRVNTPATSLPRILFADWSQNEWQILTYLSAPDHRIVVLFRDGAHTTFVSLTSTLSVPLGQWTRVHVAWDRDARRAGVYIDGALAGSQEVASNVQDIDLFKSSTAYYQFGAKADATDVSAEYAPLNSDVRNLLVLKGVSVVATTPSPPPPPSRIAYVY